MNALQLASSRLINNQ